MSKNLVIVESPAKAKTIEKYLGKDYTVKSSFGHIRDLPKKGIAIDKEHDFAPTYEVPADKKKVVSELRAAAKTATTVWLASDEDREGEAIAWHLCQALKLDPKKTNRIVFHEITKQAILDAIEHPRTVDQHLVDAQQARRILDRLVGYELSPVLWKKVRSGLSAGRVQSVAVRLIQEREREIASFAAESSFKVTADFLHGQEHVPAELNSKLSDQDTARQFLDDCKTATYTIANITTKPGTRSPSAPFTTSSLQQEASRRLGYSVRLTMSLAQRLYENGHITYMRTDSTNLSEEALHNAATYIKDTFGPSYHQRHTYKTKQASAQEAHEAIRPTSFSKQDAGSNPREKKLYSLIWQRALASQMTSARTNRTEVIIDISTRPKEHFIAKGEVLEFDGFLKVYGGGKDDTLLPELTTGQKLLLDTMHANEVFSRPPARYSEASLVKKLEELGIGRPSTYAPTISTIQDRGYIEKSDVEGKERTVQALTLKDAVVTEETTTDTYGADRNKLIPTHLAEMATDFLVKYFADIVDYDFTANVEKEFDEIAQGKKLWEAMIKEFYADFHPLIEGSETISRQETSQARQLGIDPKTEKPLIARYGKFGPMLQLGATESEEKPRFAPMPVGATLTTVTFEQAIEMFKLPRVVGTTVENEEITANIGRFGPYIQIGKTYVSIKGHDPLTISEETARELYKEKQEKDANKYIHDFGTIKVVRGPYGPYVTDGKKNAKIPKDKAPESLTEAEAKELIANAPERKKGYKRRKKK